MLMRAANRTSAPTPIAIFFQAFIAPVTSGELICSVVRYAPKRFSSTKCNDPGRLRIGAHILCYDPDREKVPIKLVGVPRPVTGRDVTDCPPEPLIIVPPLKAW